MRIELTDRHNDIIISGNIHDGCVAGYLAQPHLEVSEDITESDKVLAYVSACIRGEDLLVIQCEASDMIVHPELLKQYFVGIYEH